MQYQTNHTKSYPFETNLRSGKAYKGCCYKVRRSVAVFRAVEFSEECQHEPKLKHICRVLLHIITPQ